MDFTPMVNISPFGMCITQANPQVAAATAAAMGVLTPQPCVPVVTAPWSPGSPCVKIQTLKALSDDSTCNCQWTGSIGITPAPASRSASHGLRTLPYATGSVLNQVGFQVVTATGEEAASGALRLLVHRPWPGGTSWRRRWPPRGHLAARAGAARAARALPVLRLEHRLGAGLHRGREHRDSTACTGTRTSWASASTMAPRAWLLKRRKNSRIFQGQYLHQIVSTVLCESEVRHRWNLANTVPQARLLRAVRRDRLRVRHPPLRRRGGRLLLLRAPGHFHRRPGARQRDRRHLALGHGRGHRDVGRHGRERGGRHPRQRHAQDGGVGGERRLRASSTFTSRPGGRRPHHHRHRVRRTQRRGRRPRLPPTAPRPTPTRARVVGERHPRDDAQGRRRAPRRRAPDHRLHLLAAGQGQARRDSATTTSAGPCCCSRRTRTRATPPTPPPRATPSSRSTTTTGKYEKPEVSSQIAGVVLEQRRAGAETAQGRSECARLSPGHSFELDDPADHDHDGKYTVVRVRHEMHNAGTETNVTAKTEDIEAIVQGCARAIRRGRHDGRHPPGGRIREAHPQVAHRRVGGPARPTRTSSSASPADFACRPPQRKRNTRTVTESAVVVGPIGQEIYTDRFGRVKVQFQWDRAGKWNDASSCWVRCRADVVLGAGFGFQFIPRVGMEVLVTFLAGDPDRPVVIGSLYNATHATPDALPVRSTRSGIRTQTSPGGGGFNELSFEDAKGVERVHLHAQKDLHEIVNDTHTLNVKKQPEHDGERQAGDRRRRQPNQRLAVGENQVDHRRQEPGGVRRRQPEPRPLNVLRNETSVVQGNRLRLGVGGVAVHTVKTDDLTLVEGDQNVAVHGNVDHARRGQDQTTPPRATPSPSCRAARSSPPRERLVFKAEKPVKGPDGTFDASSHPIRLECGDSFLQIDARQDHDERQDHRDRATATRPRSAARRRRSSSSSTATGPRSTGDPIEHAERPRAPSMTSTAGNAGMIAGPDGANRPGKDRPPPLGPVDAGRGAGEHHAGPPRRTRRTLKLKFTHLNLQTQTGGARSRAPRTAWSRRTSCTRGTTGADGSLQVWVPEHRQGRARDAAGQHERYPDIYPRGAAAA